MPWSTKTPRFPNLSPVMVVRSHQLLCKFFLKTALSKHFMNNELDNYPANFVHHKAATPPSTNPGTATGARQTSTSAWPHWVVLKTAFTVQHNTDNVSLCQHRFVTFSPTPVARALFHLNSKLSEKYLCRPRGHLSWLHSHSFHMPPLWPLLQWYVFPGRCVPPNIFP